MAKLDEGRKPSMILDDPVAEANRLISAASEEGIAIRALGGAAVKIALGDRLDPRFDRVLGDLDLICQRRKGSQIEGLLEQLGWEPRRQFNAINGARRMLFENPADEEKLDLFVGDFEMCHTIPLSDRLDLHPETLAPADILLTKLQIIELNAKDRSDCYAILLGFPTSDGTDTSEVIALSRFSELTRGDWGLFHTLEINFGRLRDGVSDAELTAEEGGRVGEAIGAIESAMEAVPKTRSWKLRAKIGERKRWYDEPAEIG